MLQNLVTHSTNTEFFLNKISNNVLFLNKKRHIFGIKPSPLLSFCNLYSKTPFMNMTMLNAYGRTKRYVLAF